MNFKVRSIFKYRISRRSCGNGGKIAVGFFQGFHSWGCCKLGSATVMHLLRSLVIQGLMQPLPVVELEVPVQAGHGFSNVLVTFQVNLFVLDGAPEAFDKDVVKNPAPAIHADPDSGGFQPADEFPAGKLGALITVKNLRAGLLQRLVQGRQAKAGVQRVENSQLST